MFGTASIAAEIMTLWRRLWSDNDFAVRARSRFATMLFKTNLQKNKETHIRQTLLWVLLSLQKERSRSLHLIPFMCSRPVSQDRRLQERFPWRLTVR